MVEKDIPTCYVAIDSNGEPCYRQWLMDSKQNDLIREFWGKSFPVLQQDEALIESVFTIPKYRGQAIMPKAMAMIAEKAKANNTRFLMLFVDIDNIASLKGSHRSGFAPYTLRTEHWFLFRRNVTFEDVPKEMMEYYLKKVNHSHSA